MRSSAIAVGSLATVLAGLYVPIVALGLPYDEASHWDNVVFIADHGSVPVIGDEGTSYEAQMGPVVYFLDAAVLVLGRLLGVSDDACAYAVRLLGLPVLLGLFVTTRALLRLALPTSSPVTNSVAAAIAVLNPMVVGMTMSVQNDSLALLLALVSLRLGLQRNSSPRGQVVLGALLGLAILTKLTAWPAGPALVGLLLLRHRRQAVPSILRLSASALLVSGWWFVRNLRLYGDLTGQNGVESAGYNFAAYPTHGAAAVTHMAGQVVTYLWLPVEYVRNTVDTPQLIKATVIVATAAIIAGSLARARGAARTDAGRLLLATASLALVGWAVTFLAAQAVAPRVAYVGLGGWAVLTATALNHLENPRLVAVGVFALLTSLHIWFLVAVASVPWAPGIG